MGDLAQQTIGIRLIWCVGAINNILPVVRAKVVELVTECAQIAGQCAANPGQSPAKWRTTVADWEAISRWNTCRGGADLSLPFPSAGAEVCWGAPHDHCDAFGWGARPVALAGWGGWLGWLLVRLSDQSDAARGPSQERHLRGPTDVSSTVGTGG